MLYHNTAGVQNSQYCYDRTPVNLYPSGPGDAQDIRPPPSSNPASHQMGGKSCDLFMSCDHHYVMLSPPRNNFQPPVNKLSTQSPWQWVWLKEHRMNGLSNIREIFKLLLIISHINTFRAYWTTICHIPAFALNVLNFPRMFFIFASEQCK